MTLLASAHVPTGIVISADSCTVNTFDPPPETAAEMAGRSTVLLERDGCSKLFCVYDRFAVGIAGFFQTLTLEAHVREFEREHPCPPTTLALAARLTRYFRTVEPDPPRALLLVAGYDADARPMLLRVGIHLEKVQFLNYERPTAADGPPRFGSWCEGYDAIARLLTDRASIAFNGMSLQHAVDFTRHLVHATAEQQRFETEPVPVGGFIETAIVTPTGARLLTERPLEARPVGAPRIEVA